MYILNYAAIHTSGRISKNSRGISLTHGGIELALGVFSMKLMSKSKSFLCLPHLIEARRTEMIRCAEMTDGRRTTAALG
jgi:hypothetical protein